MTRDEAIEIEKRKLNKIMVSSVNHVAAANIDALIELGLLKVDEPKSDRQKFEESMKRVPMNPIDRQFAMMAYDEVHK